MPELSVRAVGAQALLEDPGRPGLGHLGVPPSGAADRGALAAANRLLGNPAGAAGIEIVLGGFLCTVDGPCVVAVTGAPVPVSVGGHPAAFGSAVRVEAGASIRLEHPPHGLRSYLAVRGGLLGVQHFGSVSADPTSGLGHPPLRPGTLLQLGVPSGEPVAGVSVPGVDRLDGPLTLAATTGPRADRLTPDAARILRTATWTVTSQLDRVGVRLDGPTLSTTDAGELPSEGIVRGAVQLPPSGQPLIFLADHPVTGGYPVIAVVDDAATDRISQLRPGEQVRFAIRRAAWLARE